MARPPATAKRLDLARRAVAVLQVEGVDVSTTRLANALGIKRPTLLYHFPTRAHIAELALEDLLREQTEYVLPRILAHEHPLDQIYAHICAVHAFHQGRDGRLVFLAQAIATCGEARMAEIIDVGNRVFAPYRNAVTQRLRDGIAAGTIAAVDPDALMAIVRALMDGLVLQRLMTGLDLAPVHDLLWTQLLEPLKRIPSETAP
jgi:AcrR family transcriptional regulator